MSEPKQVVFHVTSNFGHRTQKPFVMVTVGEQDFMAQMSPDEARSLAMNLLQCAEASENDAFLVTFLRKRVKANDQAIASILEEYRKFRGSE